MKIISPRHYDSREINRLYESHLSDEQIQRKIIGTSYRGIELIVERHHLVDYVCNFKVYVRDVLKSRTKIVGFIEFRSDETPTVLRYTSIDSKKISRIYVPHSQLHKKYQKRGIVSGIYNWFLASGHCLLCSPVQTVAASNLWLTLAKSHRKLLIDCESPTILPETVSLEILESRCVRMLLLGKGRSKAGIEKICKLGRKQTMQKMKL